VVMKGLSAGLTFLNCATVAGLLLGMLGGGLNQFIAFAAVILGILAGVAAYLTTTSAEADAERSNSVPTDGIGRSRYASIWCWIVVAGFGIFAVRSFCWLLYNDGQELKIQSPNNLGDLALHITFIRNFASEVSLWPDNPIYVFSHLRYPAGMDLFNALLTLLSIDLIRGLVWVGLLASIATCYAFYRWGGTFGIAGFLFNGGVVGFQILNIWRFDDFQGVKTIAWKSIPLTMFVTQRGLLFAIPAGLLLLWHWRETFVRSTAQQQERPRLPLWVEVSLYAAMPLFHFHTFLALTIVILFLFAFGDPPLRGHFLILIACAFLPATFFVWLITEHFHAGSVLQLNPGWVVHDPDFERSSFLAFWWINFGLWLPIVALLLAICSWKAWKHNVHLGVKWFEIKWPENLPFLLAAVAIFVLGLLVKLAPWGWDNLKVMIWAYFIVLPYLWRDLIAHWSLPGRIAVCIALFGSGFVSLFGGLKSGAHGFADRGEVDWVGVATEKLPVEARFAAYPTYNHPLLLQGRKVALGYPGHLWTEGFDYAGAEALLQQLMKGEGDWLDAARRLRVRFLFWGSEEKINYLTSTRPWEKTFAQVASSAWGTIYDLESPVQPAKPSQSIR
jgi:hypothetical protein